MDKPLDKGHPPESFEISPVKRAFSESLPKNIEHRP